MSDLNSSVKDRANTEDDNNLPNIRYLSLHSELSEDNKLHSNKGLENLKRAHRSESMSIFDTEVAL